MRIAKLLLLLLLTLGAGLAQPLEFSAYISADGRDRFMLTEVATGRRSGWLRTGESFLGFVLGAFDAKAESLAVSQAHLRLSLPLRSGKIQSRNADTAPLFTFQLNPAGEIGDPEIFKQLLTGAAGLSRTIEVELQWTHLEAPVDFAHVTKAVREAAKALNLTVTQINVVARS